MKKLFIMLVLLATATVCVMAQATDLFISEYLEGSANNRAVEIYNGTGASVNLSNYKLKRDFNGDNNYNYFCTLSGVIENGKTLVVMNPNAAFTVTTGLVVKNQPLCEFTGNDQIILLKNNVVIDHIGIAGDVNFGENKKFVRCNFVTSPQENCFNGFNNSEWVEAKIDNFTTLGNHYIGEDLIISEYLEGAKFNKAIELFNPTNSSVDLSNYELKRDFDGNNFYIYYCKLYGILQPGKTFIVVHPYSDIILATSNVIKNQPFCEFNGNDQVVLLKNGVIIDKIGIPKNKMFGQNSKYIRRCTVTQPSAKSVDPQSSFEWVEQDIFDYSSLGEHLFVPENVEYEKELAYSYNTSGENTSRTIVIQNRYVPIQENYYNNYNDSEEDAKSEMVTDMLDGKEIVIFPNPTMGDLTVRIPQDLEGEYFIAVYSLRGELVIRERAASGDNRVDITNSLPGVYVMRITGVNQTLEWKIIKK